MVRLAAMQCAAGTLVLRETWKPTHDFRAGSNRSAAVMRLTGVARIVVADDYEVVRIGLRRAIETHANWQVTGEAADGRDTIDLILEQLPDLAIVDYSLPTLNGLEVVRNVKARRLETKCIILSAFDEDDLIEESYRAGANAFVAKSDGRAALVSAIDAALKNKPYFSGDAAEPLVYRLQTDPPKSRNCISPKESAVIHLVAQGYTNKEIASRLCVSAKTIESHRSTAMRKLGVRSSVGLVRYAIKRHLVD
jgi:DNA-binding NarL/FixJ family response regulator